MNFKKFPEISLVNVGKLIILILMIAFGVSLYKYIKSLFSDNVESEVTLNSGNLSIDSAVASNIAQSLQNNMNFVSFRPSEIYDILKDYTKDDLRLIYNKFGRRIKIFPSPFGLWEKMDLIGWIKNTVNRNSQLYADLETLFLAARLGW